jgi:5-hydroxyisourate hydrolase/2-oxo-4-hydroxy-4-carboxy-5-ureidoimidazoline decarboxylase
MTLQEFNQLDAASARELLTQCCGGGVWVEQMLSARPFLHEAALVQQAEDSWYGSCGEADWLEAFTHHPKIGDVSSLKAKFASTQHLAGKEQAAVESASDDVIEKLAEANRQYETKFGFIFIVCATGKSADEMLRLLQERLKHSRDEELAIAMGEQYKITILRLKKILPAAKWEFLKVSQLTTHVLDTSVGKTGKDICIRLQRQVNGNWQHMALGITNGDGRIPDLLPPSYILPAGAYQLIFDTQDYFDRMNQIGFYPEVTIQFQIVDSSHYHVPLLINPYGYSTYRGS